ncbi:hypothetical protein D4764_16G0007900 [Takifugu flavidus]|uniref:Uncharacterized protein n=1 Tax=Takifugu flavidus TaxID=433684 RepID=A0A5C6NY97_9TELE|nr:hypothetical protein D4764_16G0007900 [Takifugu flavidus]
MPRVTGASLRRGRGPSCDISAENKLASSKTYYSRQDIKEGKGKPNRKSPLGSGQQSAWSTLRGCPPITGLYRCGGNGCLEWSRGPGRILVLASSPARVFTRISANNVTRQRELCSSLAQSSYSRRNGGLTGSWCTTKTEERGGWTAGVVKPG